MGAPELVVVALLLGVLVGQVVLAFRMGRSSRTLWNVLGVVPALVPAWPLGLTAYVVGRTRREKRS